MPQVTSPLTRHDELGDAILLQRPAATPLWLPRTLLAVIVLVVYANAFGLGLAFDGALLTSKDTRTHGASLQNVGLILTTPYWWPDNQDRLYRPLTTLSFLLNFAAFGNGSSPVGYHVVNILLHVLNAWLVFALARRILGAPWPAFFAAVLWAVHPTGPDTVANIAGRSDLLATAAVLGGLLLYLGKPRSPWRIAALFALALAAVGSKETGAMLIGLMALSDLIPAMRPDISRKWRIACYCGVGAALAVYLGLRTGVFAAAPALVPGVTENPLCVLSFWGARWTALKILALDFGLLLWPARLACDRSFNQIPAASSSDPLAWTGLAIALALVAAILLRRSRPNVCWLAGFFALTLLPASNLLILIGAPMAERFLYLPAIAFAIGIAAAAWRFAPSRTAAATLAMLAVACGARTVARNPAWDSNLSLMSHDVTTAPDSFRIHQVLGESLYLNDPKKLPETLRELEAAWSILSPLPAEQNSPDIPAGLATYYDLAAETAGRDTPEARVWFERAVSLLRRAVEIARARERVYDQAQLQAGKPLPPRRHTQDIYVLLAANYLAVGRRHEAIEIAREGRGVDPTASRLYDIAVAAQLAAGDPNSAALTQLEWALAIDPTPAVLQAVGKLYSGLEDGACAITEQNGAPALDFHCPRLRADLCRALPEVARTYSEARRPDRARQFTAMAGQYGCPAR